MSSMINGGKFNPSISGSAANIHMSWKRAKGPCVKAAKSSPSSDAITVPHKQLSSSTGRGKRNGGLSMVPGKPSGTMTREARNSVWLCTRMPVSTHHCKGSEPGGRASVQMPLYFTPTPSIIRAAFGWTDSNRQLWRCSKGNHEQVLSPLLDQSGICPSTPSTENSCWYERISAPISLKYSASTALKMAALDHTQPYCWIISRRLPTLELATCTYSPPVVVKGPSLWISQLPILPLPRRPFTVHISTTGLPPSGTPTYSQGAATSHWSG
mmetsp:Transcript_40988/g.78272  ORF Transcript_40988/g.78272 Transcript_40988/m.78272 type:complete len:269 (+) Transcript_40988:982-1788(+)